MATNNAPKVECTIPVLPVSDLATSVEFYSDILGFSLDWGDVQNDSVCSVSRDGRPIMLMKRPAPLPHTCVWIGLEDDSLFNEFRAKGVKVLQEPQNRPWAYEMRISDIDGNVLWLGTEPRAEAPCPD
jgi:predicted lactoylglutathione lyase